LVCERKREVRAFEPVEYWSLTALLKAICRRRSKPSVAGPEGDNKKFRLENENSVQEILKSLENAPWVIGEVEKKERRRFPTPPFVTSKLQQEASRKLGFQPKRTMQLAQQLYEGVELGSEGAVGLITYMRTDSTRVSNDALRPCAPYSTQYGTNYCPIGPILFVRRRARRTPTKRPARLRSIIRPERVRRYLRRDITALPLIWDRFVASGMVPAVYDQTAEIPVKEALFAPPGSRSSSTAS
jgi:DNA topoisomerase-1